MLITGGSGAFGQAFAARCLADGAARVAILSRGEAKQAEMRAAFNDPRLRFFIGDIRDTHRLIEACHGVDVVVHAAALKRIEVCALDPAEAMQTNIYGTHNVAKACIAAGVTHAVALSTDKAANPVTHYGATKLCAEGLWLGANVYAAGGPTRFAACRYGNVLDSTGSVLPLWRRQYQRNEPLTITDERATRFWMRMDDAVTLVMLALSTMRGGEILIPKIGAAPILDLARAVVEVNGTYAPGHVVTGLRANEKLHEMLITPEEARRTYDVGTHYVVEPEARTWETLPIPDAPLLPDGFTYESHTSRRVSVAALREMIA